MVAPKVCTGFEFGTTAGLTTGNAGNKLFDSQFGSPSIVTTTPRTGNYCLELNPSAGEAWVRWSNDTIGTGQTRLVLAFALRFVTSLPAADTLLAQIDTNAGPTPNIWFRTSDDKLVVNAGGGAPGTGEVAGPTVAADTWYYVELYSDCSAATHTLDWWVDGTAQTQSTTSSSASTFFSVTIGGPTGGQTYTGRYDDVVVWTDTSEITTPVGQHKVQILNVDTGVAYVLNGTAANWSTFTANGTIDSSFTVTEARDRTDEWPPTIGASADGLIQDSTSTTDNVEIAMTTYTLAAGETIAGVRMICPGWAVSTTGATFGFRSYNGTTETILQAGTVDPNFDNSTTAPAWVCKMLTEADFDTQSELDGLRFRVGFSSDAAPDIGIHAIAAELAVKEAAGGAAFTVDPGMVVLSGVDVVMGGTGTAAITVDPAVLNLSGIDPTFGGTGIMTVTVDPATLALTGQDVAFAPSGVSPLSVDPAVLSLTGIDVAFAGTGAAAATVDPGIIVLTGVDLVLAGSGAAAFTVDPATVVLFGIDVGFASAGGPQAWNVDPAVVVLTAVDVAFAASGATPLLVDPGVVVLSGVDLTLAGTGTGGFTVDPGIVVLSGVDVSLAVAGFLSVDPAVLVLSGADLILAGSGAIAATVDAGNLVLTGTEVGLATGSGVLLVDPAVLSLVGADLAVAGVGNAGFVVDSATLTLLGVDVIFSTSTPPGWVSPPERTLVVHNERRLRSHDDDSGFQIPNERRTGKVNP